VNQALAKEYNYSNYLFMLKVGFKLSDSNILAQLNENIEGITVKEDSAHLV
jgi:hypothetical protein